MTPTAAYDRANGSLCPNPEVLAAWIDQGLGAAERAPVEAHLASCDECRILVAHVLETRDAVGAAPATRSLTRWAVPAVLAVAATLLLAVYVTPMWRTSRGPDSAGSRLADLADAVGQERTVEARLTGGFRYGPLRAPVRSGGSSVTTDNWTLYAAAGRIREDAERNPSASNLHALGLAHLLLGEHDAAVQALEDAAGEQPRTALYQSDLAAAYLARAKQLDRPDDLPRALGAAERATASDETLLEARFNRALALQSLSLDDQARRAWQDYLSVDATSPWADEARRHLAALQRSAASADQARNHSPPELTDSTVEAGLDWLLRRGLPAWGEAVAQGNASDAAQQQSSLTTYAQQITARSGDQLARAVVELPLPTALAAPAHAHLVQLLGTGLLHVDADDLEAAESTLSTACAPATGALRAVCSLELGNFAVLHRDDAIAAAHSAKVKDVIRTVPSSYLEGRAHRLEGFRQLFRSDYPRVMAAYTTAYQHFVAGKYAAQASVMAIQLADLFEASGLPIEGWRWRVGGLQRASVAQSPASQQMATAMTGLLLARRGEPEASRPFLLTAASLPATPIRRVPGLLAQTRAALAAGQIADARGAITGAYAALDQTDDFRGAALKANVDELQATVLAAEGFAADAEARLTQALASMGPERQHLRGRALLSRARIRTIDRRDLAGAEADVQQAILLLGARPTTAGQAASLDDARIAAAATASLISAAPSLQSTGGLILVERLREVIDGVPAAQRLPAGDAVADVLRQFSNGIVGIIFVFADDALFQWIVADGEVQFRRRGVDRQQIESLAARLAVELARLPDRRDVWGATLTTLNDLLLGDVAALRTAREVVVIPEGPLRRVPFAALIDRASGAFVFEHAAVRVAPNLALALSAGTVPAPATILAIGEPRLTGDTRSEFRSLPQAKREALTVAALYPRSDVLLAEQATKAQVLAKIHGAQVIHFAGHAVAPQSGAARLLLAGPLGDPGYGFSPAELVTPLAGARVVLAACDTARSESRDRSGGGASLAAEFLRAGAATVVATLWKVDDSASEGFFIDVHRGVAAGRPVALSVAEAQRKCKADSGCRAAAATWIGATVFGQ